MLKLCTFIKRSLKPIHEDPWTPMNWSAVSTVGTTIYAVTNHISQGEDNCWRDVPITEMYHETNCTRWFTYCRIYETGRTTLAEMTVQGTLVALQSVAMRGVAARLRSWLKQVREQSREPPYDVKHLYSNACSEWGRITIFKWYPFKRNDNSGYRLNAMQYAVLILHQAPHGYTTLAWQRSVSGLLGRPVSCMPGYFEVINPHTVGFLTIPRASIKWV